MSAPAQSPVSGHQGWSTGRADLDQYLVSLQMEPEAFEALSNVPVPERVKIVSSMKVKDVDVPIAWIKACCKRYRLNLQQGTVAGQTALKRAPPDLQAAAPIGAQVPRLPITASSGAARSTDSSCPSPTSAALSPSPAKRACSTGPETSNMCFHVHVGPGETIAVPVFIKECVDCLQDPQTLIRKIIPQLSQQAVSFLMDFEPRVQCAVVQAVLLDPGAWNDITSALMRKMIMVKDLAGASISTAIESTTHTQLPGIVFIHIGAGFGAGLTVLGHARGILPSLSVQYNNEDVTVICVEENTDKFQVLTKISNRFKTRTTLLTSTTDLIDHIDKQVSGWTQNKVVLFLTTVHGFDAAEGEAGLHGPSCRQVFGAFQAVQKVKETVPAHRVEFITLLGHAHVEASQAMKEMWGPSMCVGCHYYQGALQERYVHVSRQVHAQHLVTVVALPLQVANGWKWMGNRGANGCLLDDCYLTFEVTRQHFLLTAKSIHDPKVLSDDQRRELASLRMVTSVPQNTERYVNRNILCLWRGLSAQQVLPDLDICQPCDELIFESIGMKATAGHDKARPCGATRYCQPCEKVLGWLAETWHGRIAIDLVVAVLKASLQAFAANDSSGVFTSTAAVHQCSASCPRNQCHN